MPSTSRSAAPPAGPPGCRDRVAVRTEAGSVAVVPVVAARHRVLWLVQDRMVHAPAVPVAVDRLMLTGQVPFPSATITSTFTVPAPSGVIRRQATRRSSHTAAARKATSFGY